MKVRALCLALALTSAAGAGEAQPASKVELALRFTAGRTSYEQISMVGDLRLMGVSGGAPVRVEIAGLQRRRVVEVTPSGAAVVDIEPIAIASRLAMPAQTVLAHRSGEGVSTLVNGSDVSTDAAPASQRVRIERNGRTHTESSGDKTSRFLAVVAPPGLELPGGAVSVGDRWTSAATLPLPTVVQGQLALGPSTLSVRTEYVLRSLDTVDGRLLATVVAASDGRTDDGSSRQNVTVTTRFDVAAGEAIDTEGTLFVDVVAPDVEPQSPAGRTRLIGQVHFLLSTIRSVDGR